MASRSQRQRIQQTEDPSHQRQAGSRTQATRQGQHPITAPLQQLQELANHSPRLAQLRQLQELANRSPQVAQLRRLQELAISSPQTTQLRSLQELANNGPQVAQLRQLQMLAEKAEPSAAAVISTTKPQAAASQPNLTGLSDRLKSNLEALSGLSMDAVRVHYNSSKPAQLHALAYAQGTDIHIGPGQERHLPHEAWHVVQQAQGRVRPTLQMAAGVAVNDDAGLEREADVMGGRLTCLEPLSWKAGQPTQLHSQGSQPKQFTLKPDEFKSSLSEIVFGEKSFPTLESAIKKQIFLADLQKSAGEDLSNQSLQKLNGKVWKFVKGMDEALRYRAGHVQVVKAMQKENSAANFGDVDLKTDVRLLGGIKNPWPSVHVNDFPPFMRSKVAGPYIKGLHESKSMNGQGYDYRPTPGILFHILK
jgi:hypothetical protein